MKKENQDPNVFEWEFFRFLSAGASNFLKIEKTGEGYKIELSFYEGDLNRGGLHLVTSTENMPDDKFVDWGKDFPEIWKNDHCGCGYNAFKKFFKNQTGISLQ